MQKTYIVTGASSGIGHAISQSLLDQGSAIYALSRTIENVAFTSNSQLMPVTVDFTDKNHTINCIESLKNKISHLSGIICCAGYGQIGSLEEFSYDQIQQQLDVNFLSHAYICKAFVPLLKKNNLGDIVFMGSDAAKKGSRKGTIYCASKFALRGFAQALRDECGRNHIRVTTINPGMLDTPFYDKLNFQPGPAPENKIAIEQITSTINHVLNSSPNTVFDEINISPLSHVVSPKK